MNRQHALFSSRLVLIDDFSQNRAYQRVALIAAMLIDVVGCIDIFVLCCSSQQQTHPFSEPGKGARRKGTATEAEKIYPVSVLIVLGEELVRLLDSVAGSVSRYSTRFCFQKVL